MHLIPRLSGCGVWGYGRVEVRLRREQRAVDQQRCWRTVRRFTYGGDFSDETSTSIKTKENFSSDETSLALRTPLTAQLQDMCRGNARCELCPVTARLRPASVAGSRRPQVAEATGRGPGYSVVRGEQRLTAVGSLCTLNSQPVLTSLAARRAVHRRRPQPQ